MIKCKNFSMIYNFHKKKTLLQFKKKFVFDYIIIGAGPAGIICCNELKKKNPLKKILLVERSDFSKNELPKKQNNFVKSKNITIKPDSRYFGIGGSSNVWGGIKTYFDDIELLNKENNKNLWPLKFGELIKIYKKLKKYDLDVHKTKRNFSSSLLERKFIYRKRPLNFKNKLVLRNIDVAINCKIENICMEKDSYCQVKNVKIFGKKIILSTGTLETIKIILKSVKKKSLKCNKKVLGRYFMNHPKITLKNFRLNKNFNAKKFIEKKENKYLVSYIGLSHPKKIQMKYNLYNSYIKILKHEPRKFNLIRKIRYKLFNEKKFDLQLFCEMEPVYGNRVFLDTKENLVVDYRLSKKDTDTLNTLALFFKSYLTKDDHKKLKKNINRKNFAHKLLDASHHCGGTSFSHNKKNAFVDKNLRVIGEKNLYICSASVFPTSGSANPTATIGALSFRLANHLSKNEK